MKRFSITLAAIIISMLLPLSGRAQTVPTAGTQRPASLPQTASLKLFTEVDINGPMQVRLVRSLDPSQLKIVYDTKGWQTSRFKAEVNKNGVLTVSEMTDSKRESITEVTIYYFSLRALSVARASVTFDDTLQSDMLDLNVTGGATLSATINTQDLVMTSTGKSASVLNGSARYFKLTISTAKFDGVGLQTVSADVDASHAAEVKIAVSERIEAVTSTSGILMYRGDPSIVRTKSALFGGVITKF